jgi:hypothetical protein
MLLGQRRQSCASAGWPDTVLLLHLRLPQPRHLPLHVSRRRSLPLPLALCSHLYEAVMFITTRSSVSGTTVPSRGALIGRGRRGRLSLAAAKCHPFGIGAGSVRQSRVHLWRWPCGDPLLSPACCDTGAECVVGWLCRLGMRGRAGSACVRGAAGMRWQAAEQCLHGGRGGGVCSDVMRPCPTRGGRLLVAHTWHGRSRGAGVGCCAAGIVPAKPAAGTANPGQASPCHYERAAPIGLVSATVVPICWHPISGSPQRLRRPNSSCGSAWPVVSPGEQIHQAG